MPFCFLFLFSTQGVPSHTSLFRRTLAPHPSISSALSLSLSCAMASILRHGILSFPWHPLSAMATTLICCYNKLHCIIPLHPIKVRKITLSTILEAFKRKAKQCLKECSSHWKKNVILFTIVNVIILSFFHRISVLFHLSFSFILLQYYLMFCHCISALFCYVGFRSDNMIDSCNLFLCQYWSKISEKNLSSTFLNFCFSSVWA